MLAQMKELGNSSGKSPVTTPQSNEGGNESGFMDDRRNKEMEQVKFPMSFGSRLEFPPFDGSNPRSWVKKCSKYFSLCKTPPGQKVELASLYLSGKAEMWFNGYVLNRPHLIWEEFVMDVCARFRDELGSQVVEDFNKLTQTGTIDQYLEKFEDLKALMLLKNPSLPMDYFVDSFVGGLSPQLKSFTKAFKPQTLAAAVDYARLQEATIQALRFPDRPRVNSGYKPPSQKGLLPTPGQTFPKTYPVQGANVQLKPRTLTAAERADKLAKGLCFFCDQPYARGHQCNIKKTQLFLIEIPGVAEERRKRAEKL